MPKLNIGAASHQAADLFCDSIGCVASCLSMPFPLTDLTLIQHRLLAIFLLAALLWVLEPVPVFATSILIITLELIMISDKGLASL